MKLETLWIVSCIYTFLIIAGMAIPMIEFAIFSFILSIFSFVIVIIGLDLLEA